jgi:hypothetical protein
MTLPRGGKRNGHGLLRGNALAYYDAMTEGSAMTPPDCRRIVVRLRYGVKGGVYESGMVDVTPRT